ncbi:MAG: ribonuclease HI [Halobacteriaceae archaeon]
MPVIECDPTVAKATLEAEGIEILPGNTEHEHWRAARGEATAVAYDNKVVVQGARPSDLTALLREDGTGEASLYFDGASRGNPGPSAIGWVLATDDTVVAADGTTIGRATNNQAEYEALLAGLQAASDYGFDELSIHGDSELVINQLTGAWETNDPVLREHRVTARELLEEFETWSATHVPRELNERADQLANDALDDAQ